MDENKITILQRDNSVSLPYIDEKVSSNSRQWINFDRDNLFPERLYEMYAESPTQNAIINNQIKYTYGAGLANYDASIFTPNLTETWEEFAKKVITDYCIFGAFSVQIIPNKSLTQYSFYHVPVNQVRLGGYNDENVIEMAYLAADWRKISGNNVIKMKVWGSEQPAEGERYLWYCKPYNPDELFYAIPKWYSAANWILADIQLSKYYLNYITNNFSSNLSVAYPSDVDDEKKAEIYNMLSASFGGASNAGNVLLLFGDNSILPEVRPIESVNADLYDSVTDIVMKYIVSANRLTSPVLAGLSTTAGFSSKSDEIIAAYTLYKLTVIDEIRNFISDKLNYLLVLNGKPRVLKFEDYDMRKEFEGETASNDAVEEDVNNVDDDAKTVDDTIEEEQL